jgi:hypothetical protein
MHFLAKKACQMPTVGFSFFATCGIIDPAMSQINNLPCQCGAEKEKEMKNVEQKATKGTELGQPFVASVLFCEKS